MSKHTEGPWRTDASYTDIFASDDEFICSCEGSRNGESFSNDENEANARLIALCPTMYDYISTLAALGDGDAQEIISKLTLDA